MNSINKQQDGDHHENLSSKAAVEKIKELVDKAKTCFFCTALEGQGQFPTRPMSVQKVDDHGNLWFLSASDSHQNLELAKNSNAQLLFQGSAHSDFLTLYGTVGISRDKHMIDELWEPAIKTWFTEGKDDPRITVLKFTPQDGYYWDTKHGEAVAFAKMLVGAAIGKTMDDSIEGKISV